MRTVANADPVIEFGSAAAFVRASDWDAVRRLVPTIFGFTDAACVKKDGERWALDRTIRLVRELKVEAMTATDPKRKRKKRR